MCTCCKRHPQVTCVIAGSRYSCPNSSPQRTVREPHDPSSKVGHGSLNRARLIISVTRYSSNKLQPPGTLLRGEQFPTAHTHSPGSASSCCSASRFFNVIPVSWDAYMSRQSDQPHSFWLTAECATVESCHIFSTTHSQYVKFIFLSLWAMLWRTQLYIHLVQTGVFAENRFLMVGTPGKNVTIFDGFFPNALQKGFTSLIKTDR